MKKLIATRYISWIVILSVTMTAAGTMLIGSINTMAFTNPLNSFFWNTILVNITFMGDAFFAFGLVFFLLFFLNKKNLSSRLLIMVFFTLLITQVIKNIFSGLPLQLFFETGNNETGQGLAFYKNIASSHVAVASTIAVFFMLYSKNTFFKTTLVLMVLLVAYSRMKLMGDSINVVLLGIVPATIATISVYKFVRKKTNSNVYYYRIRKDRKITGEQIVHS